MIVLLMEPVCAGGTGQPADWSGDQRKTVQEKFREVMQTYG